MGQDRFHVEPQCAPSITIPCLSSHILYPLVADEAICEPTPEEDGIFEEVCGLVNEYLMIVLRKHRLAKIELREKDIQRREHQLAKRAVVVRSPEREVETHVGERKPTLEQEFNDVETQRAARFADEVEQAAEALRVAQRENEVQCQVIIDLRRRLQLAQWLVNEATEARRRFEIALHSHLFVQNLPLGQVQDLAEAAEGFQLDPRPPFEVAPVLRQFYKTPPRNAPDLPVGSAMKGVVLTSTGEVIRTPLAPDFSKAKPTGSWSNPEQLQSLPPQKRKREIGLHPGPDRGGNGTRLRVLHHASSRNSREKQAEKAVSESERQRKRCKHGNAT